VKYFRSNSKSFVCLLQLNEERPKNTASKFRKEEMKKVNKGKKEKQS
jgi:hypothetical protein